jgi:hypothetical protein
MTSQPLIVTPDTPVAEVLARARIKDPDLPVTVAAQVYVCEPPMVTPSGGYLGSVGFQRLLRRPPSALVGQCVEASVLVRPDLPDRDLVSRCGSRACRGPRDRTPAERLTMARTAITRRYR